MLVNVFDGNWNGGYLVVGGSNLLRGTKDLKISSTDIVGVTGTYAYGKYGDFACVKMKRAWYGVAFNLSAIMKRCNLQPGDTLIYSTMVMIDFVPDKDLSFSLYRTGMDPSPHIYMSTMEKVNGTKCL